MSLLNSESLKKERILRSSVLITAIDGNTIFLSCDTLIVIGKRRIKIK